ncbi:hypothetical protein UlMin_026212 [Ulmus minor]
MASPAIRCGGNCDLVNRRIGNSQCRFGNQNAQSCCLMIRNFSDSSRGRRGAVSAAMSPAVTPVKIPAERKLESLDNGENSKEVAVVYEKLDEWMSESVTEIVKNLRQAPLLVQVYNGINGDNGRMVMEKAVVEEDWTAKQRKWETGEAAKPEGLIFVEELSNEAKRQEEELVKEQNDDDGITKAWGVVVQGKGVECPPACYLLKTSRVVAGAGAGAGSGFGFGAGLGCTHFCLVRVNSFWETAESQMKNCWLLQAQAKGCGL